MIGLRMVFLFLLCSFLTAETHALRCFVCGLNEDCGTNYQLQTVNCGTKDPNLYNYQCVKYSIGGAVARGCFLDTFCREQPYCHACDYDYCNGATSMLSSSIMKLLAIVLTMGLLLARRT